MMRKIILLTVLLSVILFSGAHARADEVLEVEADVPRQSGYDIKIYKIIDNKWTDAQTLAFDDLYYDEDNQIMRAKSYYAVEVGVYSNAQTWTLNHRVKPLTYNDTSLDNNINVVFDKQIDAQTSEFLEKVSFADSNKSFVKDTLKGGWLRIYYGIASGSDDAEGVVPLTANMSAGEYTGEINITLTE